MVSLGRRREAVAHLERTRGVSERRACRVVDQPRSTQRYRATIKDDEPRVVARMRALVREHPRFGYRRIHALLRREGFRINRKRVWRLWKREGFKVPRRVRKPRGPGVSAHAVHRRPAQGPRDVWCWDFIPDRDARGGPLKWLLIGDEYTRELLAMEGDRHLTSEGVCDVFASATVRYGVPAHLRSDNGAEFIARGLRRFLERAGVGTRYVAPGRLPAPRTTRQAGPWENGYAESFGSRVRDEFLAREVFADVREAKALTARWREEYNSRRPHSSLGYRTPAEFAAAVMGASVGATPLPPPPSPPNPRLS